jgi:thymidylate synthase
MSFSLIVVVTRNYKIQDADKVPWDSKQYTDYFEHLTADSVVLMGRKTFERLPLDKRPFTGRLNVVLSREYPKYRHLERDNLIFCDMRYVLNELVPQNPTKTFWLIGGKELYETLGNMAQSVYMTVLDKLATGERPMNFTDLSPAYELVKYGDLTWSEENQCRYRLLQYKRNETAPSLYHESQYLQLLNRIIFTGNDRSDRTGVGTVGLFGNQQRWDVSKYLPILTTKLVPIGVIVKELLWFLRGETDAKILQQQAVHIWDGNSSREFLDNRGLTHYEVGDIGPGYGFLERYAGLKYEGCNADYKNMEGGFDQLEYMVNLLKTDPFSRRILMTHWIPTYMKEQALPPCHVLFQLYVEEDKETGNRYLSGHLYQRSQDYFLAANFNLVSYTILLHILAKKVDMYPKEMIVSWGDLHVYKNHIEQAKEQMKRHPRPQPILEVNDSVKTKDWQDITIDDFSLIGYFPQPAIKAEMAV